MRFPFLLLASTFLIGALSGGYLFFVTRSSEPAFGFLENDTAGGFEITADAYGGCQRTGACPSYHITDDGAYVYLLSARAGEDREEHGTLSSSQFSELKGALRAAPLADIAPGSFSGTCPVARDGTAYRYDIRIGDTSYRFDTCEEDVGGERLFDLLAGYFDTLAN
jgi:hypothetical protein